jgi:hypothetical protein
MRVRLKALSTRVSISRPTKERVILTGIEFKAWPKTARLNRDIVITEKLDGTNAAVGIYALPPEQENKVIDNALCLETVNGVKYVVYAQSRKRLIGLLDDNHQFAAWVWSNGQALVSALGEGLHFGEWWGSGVNRGYGLLKGEKRFSLFNTIRYNDPEKFNLAPLKNIGVDTVPVLYEGLFNEFEIKLANDRLVRNGSSASPGFMNPEGIIVFHTASQTPYKITIEGDEKPKGSTN